MSANQNTVAAAMEQASINVNMVAAAAEEMSATITEIAENSSKAKDMTSIERLLIHKRHLSESMI